MLRSSFSYLIIRLLNGLLSLIALYALSRLLTAAEYGRYALISAAIATVASVAFQWVNVGVARFHSANRHREGVLVGEVGRLYIRCAAVVLSALFVVAVWPPAPWITTSALLTIVIGTFCLALHTLGLQFSNARQDSSTYALISVSRGLLGLIAAVALVVAGLGGVGAAAGFSLAAGASVLLLVWQLRHLRLGRDDALRRELVSYGAPLGVTYLATMVLDFSGRFIIASLIGEAAVGSYAVGYDLVQQVIGATTNAIFLAAFPAIVRSWDEFGATAATQSLNKVFQLLAFTSPLLLIPFLAVPKDIASIMFGDQMSAPAATVIPWIAVGIWLAAFKSFYLDIAFQLAKRTHDQLYITVAMALLNLLLVFVLIAYFGIEGAAMATTATFAVGVVLSWWFGRREGLYGFSFGQCLLGVVLVIIGVFTARWGAGLTNGGFSAVLAAGFLGIGTFLSAALAVDFVNARQLLARLVRRGIS